MSRVLLLTKHRIDADAVNTTMSLLGLPQLPAVHDVVDVGVPEHDRTIVLMRTSSEADHVAGALQLREQGHNVALFGQFDQYKIDTLAAAGVQVVVRDQILHLHALITATPPQQTPPEQSRSAEGGTPQAQQSSGSLPVPQLTCREVEIAQMICTRPQLKRAELARLLGIRPATAKAHLENLRKKVGAVGLTQAALVDRLLTLGVVAPQSSVRSERD